MKLMEVGVIHSIRAADAPAQMEALAAQGLQVQVKVTCPGCGVIMTCTHRNTWVDVADCPLCGTNFRAEAVSLLVTVDSEAGGGHAGAEDVYDSGTGGVPPGFARESR